MTRIAAIIPAAGLGTRMGAERPKQFLELDGVPLMIFTLRRLAACAADHRFFISTRADDIMLLCKTSSPKPASAARRAWSTAATRASNRSRMRSRKSIRPPKLCWCTMRCAPSSPPRKSIA